MKVRIKWIENVAFACEVGQRACARHRRRPEAGGRNLGPRPMEMVLMGAGLAAPSMWWKSSRKSRQPITDCVVDVEAGASRHSPKKSLPGFTSIL